MGKCKEIIIKVIPASVANPFVKAHHYSGKVVPNSQLHFGAFLDGKLHGVLSYGCSMDKRKTMALVKDTGWNEFLELNRMAFDDYLPRNSESYCIGATLRMIKKQAPHIKWIISFADGCSCGDGTIYRASNFILTDIRENHNLCELPNGEKIHKMTLESQPTIPRKELNGKCYAEITGGGNNFRKYVQYVGGKVLPGYQLRYVYFLDKKSREKLTVPELPYSAIDEMGAGLYKNEHISREERHKKCEAQIEREQRKQQPAPKET